MVLKAADNSQQSESRDSALVHCKPKYHYGYGGVLFHLNDSFCTPIERPGLAYLNQPSAMEYSTWHS